ncbi:2-keto-4-pentenoate hydratase/2-oxohepta-3-ene-1,7-dioic acid hydratase in catechol pathway [Geomicrobium halophilum]|uniref:2-keto-4-pentenoate hydratase/2-oxohepta-3-ene-1,7-dioic acid hydratase in catechol pathway n=1 Tax=Geomicrobium halophilum TaxID=549000 RepID=A0A841PLQ5_9BACL|nr:fumarylacetoacetate hydrolase family protein [Geomicrobium halophilum]MBB6448624.1 2-keto-4-pentenoate hydratase/2-oxohepta-3-ene-1,7-dioic acid hydratase in catechol pathway [Geomicrobium halophilum]
MKLCTYQLNGERVLGVAVEEGIVNVKAALENQPQEGIPTRLEELLSSDGGNLLENLKQYISKLSLSNQSQLLLNEEDVNFGAPIGNPEKIICVGLNYQRHADETGSPYPEVPILFNKFNNTLTSHRSEIEVPKVTDQMDYEVELAVIVGKEMKDVPEDQALDYVFGYSTANDLSARDLQIRTPQWLLGKTCDDFSPIGPYVVTSDKIKDPQTLDLKTTVNGEVRQDSNTSDMIFSCKSILSYISRHMTLKPGDIILTGTPEGVALGMPEDKREFLKPGDEVTVEIEKLGSLTNRFIEAK